MEVPTVVSVPQPSTFPSLHRRLYKSQGRDLRVGALLSVPVSESCWFPPRMLWVVILSAGQAMGSNWRVPLCV